MSKSRNIWILAQRNDDPNKPSMLIILKNVTLSSPNSTTPWQSTCVAYIENDIKQRMKITPMYYDDYKWINVPRMKKEFQKWSDLNIVKQEDINSWNILFSKMSNTLENSCEECCILKQNTAMQNDRKCQKFSPDEVCFFFTHCTQCSKFCYNQFKEQHQRHQQRSKQKYENHKKICENSKISKNFYTRWSFLKYHKTEITQNLQLNTHGLSKYFWKIAQESTKYSQTSIKKLVDLINDIKIPNKFPIIEKQQDVEMKMHDIEEEKQTELHSSVCSTVTLLFLSVHKKSCEKFESKKNYVSV